MKFTKSAATLLFFFLFFFLDVNVVFSQPKVFVNAINKNSHTAILEKKVKEKLVASGDMRLHTHNPESGFYLDIETLVLPKKTGLIVFHTILRFQNKDDIYPSLLNYRAGYFGSLVVDNVVDDIVGMTIDSVQQWVYYRIASALSPAAKVEPGVDSTSEKPHPVNTWIEPHTGMEFVWVPEGCFQMGCGSGDNKCRNDEKPTHEVCLDGFWMGRYEVTQAQWEKVMGTNPSDFKEPRNPVENVSWDDVQEYVKKLHIQSSTSGLRLPTEAEWEYACRSGGKPEIYCGGNNVDSVAWYSDNSGGTPHSVGGKSPNALGIYDMSGNVSEWVSDWYGFDYYAESPRDNPQGPSIGWQRVLRGGGWFISPARMVRSTDRMEMQSYAKGHFIGFRLARSAQD